MTARRAAEYSVSSSALGQAPVLAAGTRPGLSAGIVGEAGSPQALTRLNAAISELRALAAQPFLTRAVDALRAEDAQGAAEFALAALEQDERNGFGWYLLGIARDKSGDLKGALQCYEAALALLPDHDQLANDLGRLAYRLDMKPVAEQLFRRFLAANPGSIDGANNLACALRDQNRYAEAIETLTPAIGDNPDSAQLWNTLGTVLAEQGDFENCVTFLDEALRLDPAMCKARYNRGNARLALGDAAAALTDNEAALAEAVLPEERAMMRLSRSTIRLNLGDVGEGWDDYEARLDPQFADVTHFMIDRPRWTPGDDLAGKTLLVMGEQGLGDEVLFANLLPDVIAAVGEAGKVLIAVEPRLVELFQRSFPTAEVGAHATYKVDARLVRGAPFARDRDDIDLWIPIASLLRRFRRSVEAYPSAPSFLAPDPARVAHWRAVLAEAGLSDGSAPVVGLLWKSLKTDGARHRYFSPFEQWAEVLAVPGARFINLQYGDCAEEIAHAADALGVNIWTPPGIDLKQDLDDLAALCVAVGLIIGPANATTNIAAACGAEVWLISNPGAWPRLGTDRYPWYPRARVFNPPGYHRWAEVMSEVAAALAARTGTEAARPG